MNKDWMEWQANAFSSAFLMPRPVVWRLFEAESRTGSRMKQIVATIKDLVSIRNVSTEAALYRLCDLHVIDRDVADKLPSMLPYLEFSDSQI